MRDVHGEGRTSNQHYSGCDWQAAIVEAPSIDVLLGNRCNILPGEPRIKIQQAVTKCEHTPTAITLSCSSQLRGKANMLITADCCCTAVSEHREGVGGELPSDVSDGLTYSSFPPSLSVCPPSSTRPRPLHVPMSLCKELSSTVWSTPLPLAPMFPAGLLRRALEGARRIEDAKKRRAAGDQDVPEPSSDNHPPVR